jgi:hypothetical protein
VAWNADRGHLSLNQIAVRGTRYQPGRLGPRYAAHDRLHPRRRGEYATNVEAETIEGTVRKAVEFFLDPFWKGPKPKPGTVLRIVPMGGGDERRVRLSTNA